MLRCHPDKGGTVVDFRRIMEAKKFLERYEKEGYRERQGIYVEPSANSEKNVDFRTYGGNYRTSPPGQTGKADARPSRTYWGTGSATRFCSRVVGNLNSVFRTSSGTSTARRCAARDMPHMGSSTHSNAGSCLLYTSDAADE